MIVDNTEYINKFYTTQESINYLKQKRNRENNKTIIKSTKKDKMNFDTNIDFSKGKYGDNNIDIFEDDENIDNNEIKEKNKEIINDNNISEENDDGNDYERFFNECNAAYKVGVCFDIQIVKKLETNKWDVKTDKIITEKRVIV